MCERFMDQLLLAHLPLGTWPATQACALTGNRTSDLLVCRPALNPLSHTSQGSFYFSYLFGGRTGSPGFQLGAQAQGGSVNCPGLHS